MASRNQNSIPVGWRLEHQTDKKGTIQECYTNDLHQKFYSMEELMRYVKYAMKAQLSIYEPPSQKDSSSTAKPCSKGKRKWSTAEESSSKEEKHEKTKSTAKNGGTKKKSILKFHHIFYRLSQRLNKPTNRKKYANSLARRKIIKDAFGKTLSRGASTRLARNAPKYNSRLDIAATTHHVPNSPARLALTVLPPRASRRLSRQAPEYVPDFDPLLKY